MKEQNDNILINTPSLSAVLKTMLSTELTDKALPDKALPDKALTDKAHNGSSSRIFGNAPMPKPSQLGS